MAHLARRAKEGRIDASLDIADCFLMYSACVAIRSISYLSMT